ncbi:hypothetical protein [Polaribacter glomeratus]|uniref:DUF4352 domain-containing protein n=1 Tax=Polaribacter glomeratus TaxID=102 RepID=A0A2S7WI95_9FLAO|nr:hypothetical protein [Polaribacter glomeratus]PQJ77002.1 hypothetical protein BTO16_14190 [Polaribacter glomeratus]TXD67148.1 hypothetical protein ESX12_00725 [Polaribacter glomeratus]
MNLKRIILSLTVLVLLGSCASGYKAINPSTINYYSSAADKSVTLQYKYELLDKKYKKKEVAKGVRLVAIKITNNSNEDLVFGDDISLTYDDGSKLYIMDNDKVYSSLKQKPATYLWYLLLTPMNLYTNKSQNGFQTETSSTPIGLIVGPGLAGGNMIAATSANKKFEQNLLDYNINGATIKKGETVSGLIGLRADGYNSIKIKVN